MKPFPRDTCIQLTTWFNAVKLAIQQVDDDGTPAQPAAAPASWQPSAQVSLLPADEFHVMAILDPSHDGDDVNVEDRSSIAAD